MSLDSISISNIFTTLSVDQIEEHVTMGSYLIGFIAGPCYEKYSIYVTLFNLQDIQQYKSCCLKFRQISPWRIIAD